MKENPSLISEMMLYLIPLITAIVSIVVGYLIGSYKFFREQVLRVYEHAFPVIRIFMITDPGIRDTDKFKEALAQIWLYGKRDVAIKLDKAIAISVDPERGNFNKAIQEVISAMRKDVHPRWRFFERNIKPEDIQHF